MTSFISSQISVLSTGRCSAATYVLLPDAYRLFISVFNVQRFSVYKCPRPPSDQGGVSLSPALHADQINFLPRINRHLIPPSDSLIAPRFHQLFFRMTRRGEYMIHRATQGKQTPNRHQKTHPKLPNVPLPFIVYKCRLQKTRPPPLVYAKRHL
jgi:hypothetical protein